MGAMSILSTKPAGGTQVDTESTERSWLEIVKAAANLEIRDITTHEPSEYPTVVEQAWVQSIKDPKDFARVKEYDYVGDVLQRVEKNVDQDKKASRLYEEECELVRNLQEKLELRIGFTEAVFFKVLKRYLRRLVLDVEGHPQNAESHRHRKAAVEVSDRRIALALVWKLSWNLGPRLISVLIDCSIFFQCWTLIHTFLQRRVVDSRDCSKIVEVAIQNQLPRTLCLCITYSTDLAPQDVYYMLVYFLDSAEDTHKSFLLVKGEWRRLVLQKIQAYLKKKDGSSSADGPSPATLLALAKAIDNFTASELCIHHLVALEQDEAVLSSVVSRLETAQQLRLLQYLHKWIVQYSSQLGNYPVSRIGRIPSLNQVFFWTSIILEGNYAQFVLSPQFHPVLEGIKGLLQPLVDLCTELTPLLGVVDHLRHRRYAAVKKAPRVAVPQAPTDYIIELLDLGG
ncbi:hypothetical protein R1flu_012181 [Riccia fluitans]|uniref:Uncharacterized protein n=1 Tax=Riccia fluitans TaxID=41844 RepID=A0ABD1Z9X3_9MARC